MARETYDRIKECGKLPSPTGVVLQILELAQQEDSSVDAIADAVQADPAISSRLLKQVNSPLAGLSRQVGSVCRAVSLLGVRTVTQLALGFSLLSNYRKGPCALFDYELFWSESLAIGVAARHLAGHLKIFATDEAFTCGLISQIGRLAFATASPEAYGDLLKAASHDDRKHLAEMERDTFGIDHCALGAEMMADWHMPGLFQQAVRAQLDPDAGDLKHGSRPHTLAQSLNLAGGIGLILPRPSCCREALSTLVVKANRLGVPPEVYHHVFDSISQEWREAGTIFSVPTRRVPLLADLYSQAIQGREVLDRQMPKRAAAATLGGDYNARG